MGFNFDEDGLREVSKKYRTFVIMTDYSKRVEVYRGSLDDGCFDMLKFYTDNGWFDGCSWVTEETPLKSGWTKLVSEAIDKNGEEVFNISVKLKGKIEDSEKKAFEPVMDGWVAFWLGILAGFFII